MRKRLSVIIGERKGKSSRGNKGADSLPPLISDVSLLYFFLMPSNLKEELLWIRDEFILNPHPLPYTVLFGHTPQREVFFDLPYKVGLDTGLVYGNQLSCLEVHDKLFFQIGRYKKKVKQRDVRDQWWQGVCIFISTA